MPIPELTISNPEGTAFATFVPQRGGMMSSLCMQAPEGRRELLYLPENFDFNTAQKMGGGAPFCFPICGRLSRPEGENRYLYNAKTYEMAIHGFGFRLPWEVIEHQTHSITLQLRDNEITLSQYPFKFTLTLRYQLIGNQLICEQTYQNLDSQPLPYYAGFHPYVRIPFPKSQVLLDYAPARRLQYNDSLTDILGERPLFSTPTPIDLPELNESLVEMGASTKVTLHFPDHSSLTLEATGTEDARLFPFVQLYHILTEPFLCIEHWMGHPNSMNSVNGTRWLAPHTSESGIFKLTFHDGLM